MTDEASKRITLHEINVVHTERSERETDRAPATLDQKVDSILGLVRLLSDNAFKANQHLERIDARLEALEQHLGGVIAATNDLRPRVEELEHHAKGTNQRFELLGIAPPNGADHGGE